MRLFLITLIILVASNAVMGQAGTGTDSSRIEELFDNYFREFLKLSPEAASQLGLPPEAWINGGRRLRLLEKVIFF